MYENDERRREKRMKEYNININNLVFIHFRKNFYLQRTKQAVIYI